MSLIDEFEKRPYVTLEEQMREEMNKNKTSQAWEEWDKPEIVSFWLDPENPQQPNVRNSLDIPFSSITSMGYDAKAKAFIINFGKGKKTQSIKVSGPRILEFRAQFRDHRASEIKADGIDIKEVRLLEKEESKESNG